MSKLVLAIDPSTIRLGWATLRLPLEEDCMQHLVAGWHYGSWDIKGTTMKDKMHSVEPLLRRIVGMGPPVHLIVEQPTFFNSEAGRIAAREGHIVRLSIMLGWIMGRLNLWGSDVTMYQPAQWKGMVPKRVTQAKFYRTFKDASQLGSLRMFNHDTVDAIMMLHYWLTQGSLTRVKDA